jgi:hypothetical protein
MSENTEEFIWYEVLFALIIAVVIFFIFYQNFSQIFPIGCNDNNILENQFSQALYGTPNRMEGTPLFRCYLTDACYSQATANQTCITNWCGYENCINGNCKSSFNTCVENPPISVLQNCKVLGPSNTAALESCQDSVMVANNATDIQNCAVDIPTCISGDSKYCAPCIGQ